MQESSPRAIGLRMAVQRVSVSLMLGSIGGQRRRSTWLHDQARLLGSEYRPGDEIIAMLPLQRG